MSRYPRQAPRLSALLLLMALLAGCTPLLRQPAPTDRQPPVFAGFQQIRYYPLEPDMPLPASVRDAYIIEPPSAYEQKPDGSFVYNYLAISGGGSDGAFGAGLLEGWSERGDRPTFKMVTGVSTGSLIAPFAFLGPAYDAVLRKAYTTVDASRIFSRHSLISLLWRESATDNAPFRALLAEFITAPLVDAIAVEHRKGRRLYVLTTDLDREQPVIWDMGAIANSPSPRRVDLFRKILLASTSIPAIFPPVMLQVPVDGVMKDEMHVDGGVFAQSFFVGNLVDLKQVVHDAHPERKTPSIHRLYVIRNGRLDPEPRVVNRTLGSISRNAINTMLKVSGLNDLYRLYVGDIGGELELHYIAIPRDYKHTTTEEFNQQEMIREYDLGRKLGKDGIPWQRLPPGYRV